MSGSKVKKPSKPSPESQEGDIVSKDTYDRDFPFTTAFKKGHPNFVMAVTDKTPHRNPKCLLNIAGLKAIEYSYANKTSSLNHRFDIYSLCIPAKFLAEASACLRMKCGTNMKAVPEAVTDNWQSDMGFIDPDAPLRFIASSDNVFNGLSELFSENPRCNTEEFLRDHLLPDLRRARVLPGGKRFLTTKATIFQAQTRLKGKLQATMDINESKGKKAPCTAASLNRYPSLTIPYVTVHPSEQEMFLQNDIVLIEALIPLSHAGCDVVIRTQQPSIVDASGQDIKAQSFLFNIQYKHGLIFPPTVPRQMGIQGCYNGSPLLHLSLYFAPNKDTISTTANPFFFQYPNATDSYIYYQPDPSANPKEKGKKQKQQKQRFIPVTKMSTARIPRNNLAQAAYYDFPLLGEYLSGYTY